MNCDASISPKDICTGAAGASHAVTALGGLNEVGAPLAAPVEGQ